MINLKRLQQVRHYLVFCLILNFVVLVANLYPQTVEQRLQRLEDSLKIVWTSEPLDTTMSKPIYEGIVMLNSSSDQYIFNPVFQENGVFYTYCVKGGRDNLAISPNGLNSWTYLNTTGKPGSTVPVGNKYYLSYHQWFGGMAYSYYAISLDKINYTDVATSRIGVGEDRNLLWNTPTEEFYQYGRKQPVPRTITFQKSSDFRTWSNPIEILTPDATDGSNKQFYHLSVIRTEQGYFGLLNVYRVGNSGQDVQQLPPYSADEHTIDVQLVFSENGITNWKRLNDRKPFIHRTAGIQQLFAWWSIVGDNAIIYTAESKRKHTLYDNTYNSAGNYYFSSRYKISLSELYKYNK